MASETITEHVAKYGDHTTAYLASGPESGPLIIFVHGWPELAVSWRHQLPVFGALGFRAIAPDMRGYGRSSVYTKHSDYAQEKVVADMIALLDAQGREQAVWVGHDWGAPVVWNIASHHPEQCLAVANLCVPYRTLELGMDAAVAQIDREVYPEAEFPVGQWDYQLYYQENFAAATAAFDAAPGQVAQLLFRKGNPDGAGKPAGTAMVRRNGGWFGGGAVPTLPRDADVVSEADLCAYASALERNGFFGPNSYYMNHDANASYSATIKNEGVLEMPVLFLHARFDYTCETLASTLAEPMRGHCRNLAEAVVDSGHWMAQERPTQVNGSIARWLASTAKVWPAEQPVG